MSRPRIPHYRPLLGLVVIGAGVVVDVAVGARALIAAPVLFLTLLWSVYEGR